MIDPNNPPHDALHIFLIICALVLVFAKAVDVMETLQ